MWKRATHLVIGIALLAISGYFLVGVAFGWKAFWRQELLRTARPPKPAKSTAHDPLSGLTDEKVYGVLNSEDGAPTDDEAVSPQTSAPPVEHIAPTVIAPNHFLHGRLSVTAYKGVEFVVPALALHPQLQGRFRSVVTNHTSAGAAVEILLMTDREFATFVRNETQTTESSAFPSNHGAIDWKLSATYGHSQKYYLVFLNAFEGQGPITIDADFTVRFE